MTEGHPGLISASSHLGISTHHFGIYRPFPGLSGLKETSPCGLTPTPRLTPGSDILMFLSVNRIIPGTEICLRTTGHQKGADPAPLRTAPGYLTRIISSYKAVCGPAGLLWEGSMARNPKGPPLWEEDPGAKDVVHIDNEKVIFPYQFWWALEASPQPGSPRRDDWQTEK